MTGSQKRKGDRAEREAATLLGRLLGQPVRRLLGAGRTDDVGDLDLDGWVIQVADWKEVVSAVRQKPVDADLQATHSGKAYGAALIRLRGGEFRIVMTPETWARWITDTPSQDSPPEGSP